MILAVALSPSVDHTYVVDSLVPGTIHWPRETVRLAGGNGLNVARAAQALGADVAAVAIVGGPNGRWIASSLETEGIAVIRFPALSIRDDLDEVLRMIRETAEARLRA